MTLLEVNNVSKLVKSGDKNITVFENLSFEVERGEFAVLIGPSGCGKSTLLRMITGLESPDSGGVYFEGRQVTKPNKSISLVFQSFALLPWLTVFENVSLGLEAARLPKPFIKDKVEKYLDKVGLGGYENAYPKELSGGMKQRVGFVRALVMDPELLCMDEPFSSVDPLTATNLRDELILLWSDKNFPLNSIVMVTHNMEEAVYLADKIIVLKDRPTRVVETVKVDLPRPRDTKSKEFNDYTEKLYGLLT